MKKDYKVTFIGAGNMGEAMIKGLLEAGLPAKNIFAIDIDKKRIQYICSKYKVKKPADLKTGLSKDATIIAVKPQQLDNLLQYIAGLEFNLPLIISIAAGIPVKRFTDSLGAKTRVIRVMPNTPALIGKGVSGYFAGPGCQKKDLSLAEDVMSGLGPAYQLTDESLMDAVTGLSGSGPAYVFAIVDALADAGVMMGLSRDMALGLAANTVMGAAAMVTETGEHPSVLKDKVASPGGTTIAGIAAMERGRFRAALMDAVAAATERSRELGRSKEEE